MGRATTRPARACHPGARAFGGSGPDRHAGAAVPAGGGTGGGMRRRWRLLRALLPVAAAVSAGAQEYYRQGGGWRAGPIREGLPEKRAGFMFCRLLYTSVRREPGGYGWNTDYPGSDHNFT